VVLGDPLHEVLLMVAAVHGAADHDGVELRQVDALGGGCAELADTDREPARA
jgi:hypothetical protein